MEFRVILEFQASLSCRRPYLKKSKNRKRESMCVHTGIQRRGTEETH